MDDFNEMLIALRLIYSPVLNETRDKGKAYCDFSITEGSVFKNQSEDIVG
jgi:hypothetical protein